MKKVNQKLQAVQLEIDKHLRNLQQEFGEALLPFIENVRPDEMIQHVIIIYPTVLKFWDT